VSDVRRIAVCGLGKLGACVAVAFAASNVPVVGFDLDKKKIDKLTAWTPPIVETELEDYLNLVEVRQHLRVTTSVEEAVRLSDACLFVTPTPSMSDGSFDHSYLLEAIVNVSKEVERQRRRKYLFVVNSTVMPAFLLGKAAPVLRRRLNGLGFGLAYKPEFIALGSVLKDLLYPDVLLIGEDSDETGEKVEKLYRDLVLHDCQVRRMPLVDAELAKISLNCAVTMKISFANQVGAVARRLGADPRRVLGAVGLDHRIGHGALRPGLPFGGPCFPRDNRMFQHVAATVGERAPLAEATDIMNRLVRRAVLDEVRDRGTIGILGLAYKPGAAIDDESPGSWWAQALRSRGRTVLTHDPVVSHTSSLEDVLACDTVIVACSCPEYSEIVVKEGAQVIDPTGEARVSTFRMLDAATFSVPSAREAVAQ
jgi:UDPglucose 6-dehydrogenase